MQKIKLHWATPIHNQVANAYGYNQHNSMMKKYSEKYMDYDDNAEWALTITPADNFTPVIGKKNILFTMWEFADLPNSYIRGIAKADAIIVPSTYCRDLFRKYTSAPVYVCREGIEPDKFPFHKRIIPTKNNGVKFRILWCGAPNPRKGYPFMLELIKVFEQMPSCEVYMKTTMPKMNWKQTLINAWIRRKEIMYKDNVRLAFLRMFRRIPKPYYANMLKVLGTHKNIIYDTRKLPLNELVELYNSAHLFILPTLGEGWGLTLCEAMATGCPSIATPVTGCADFFNDEVGYSIKYSVQPQTLDNYENLKTKTFLPDTKDLMQKVIYVMSHYDEAVRKGFKASEYIHKKFTWDLSAQRLNDILIEIQRGKV